MTNAVATGSIVIGGTLSTIIVARVLGREGLGVFTYGMWLVGLSVLVADLGIPGALARYLPDLRRQENGAAADGLARYLFGRYALLMAAGVAVLLSASAPLWKDHLHVGPIGTVGYLANPLFWLLVAAAFVGQGAGNFVVGLLRGRQEFGRMARIMLATAVIQVAAAGIGSWLFGVAGALAGSVLIGLCPAVFLASGLRRGAPVAPALRARIARYCGSTWTSYLLASVVSTRTEIFFLERSWGSSEVALFSICVTLSNLAVQAPLLLTGTLLPHLSQQIAMGEHERAAALYRSGMRFLAMMVVPACFGTAAIAPAFIPLVYGSQFADAALPAAILVGASAIGAVTSVAQIYMNASERNGFNLGVGAAGALSIVLSGLLVVPVYGVIGAALTRAAVQLCGAALLLLYAHRVLKAPAPMADLARIVASSLLCAAVAHAVIRAVPGPASVGLAIVAGIVSYGFALKLFGCITKADLAMLRAEIGILPRPFGRVLSKAVSFYA
ncbi:lipopolysaccharide biosynthesis protein [Methylobacterium sp. WSM2598]|uniref:lipopolysaccharide biosynthesis protein n=1 Tax=Methylobacterium sp. WSM2598 TaxID=398261 RepID=UPI00036614DA|nr:oligosaccharide flippase family protein [Methylobacterium sp. WSM2598]